MRTKRFLRHEPLETRQMLDASGLAAGEPQPDFDLQDVNPTSDTFEQAVGPNDFSTTTVWYFTHST